MIVALALAGVLGAAGYGLYSIGMDRGMKMGGTAAAGGGAQQAGTVDPATGRGSFTGTTRWCRDRSSTSPASRPSWTCSSCRCTRTSAGAEGTVSDQPAHAAEPRHAHRRGHAGARSRRRSKRSAPSPTTSATSALVQARSQRLRRAALRARAARPGAQGPAARRAVRSRLGRGAGGIPRRAPHGRHAASKGWSTRARQRMRLAGMTRGADPRGRIQREGAAARDRHCADRRRGGRACRARRHDGDVGRAAVPASTVSARSG